MLRSPFDQLEPHPLAKDAAMALQAELGEGLWARAGGDGGKMFGVLVAEAPGGARRVLRAFSGMLGGRWSHPGFAPPLFDAGRREALEPAGERIVRDLLARAEAIAASGALAGARAASTSVEAGHDAERARLRDRHAVAKAARRRARAGAPDAAALHALAQQSRADKAERRRMEAAQAAERAGHELHLRRMERRAGALERLRRHVCRRLMQRLHDTYDVPNARGERRPLRALFLPAEPPSGAADCAAPKLLAQAFELGLRPLALAEFWWGPPPPSGGRVSGAFYPACRDKCGPLLPFMLGGLEVAPPRAWAPPPAPAEPLRVAHEDAWVVVVEKPAGLLSVPGKGAALADSALARLRARHPAADGPLLVHRLDLDTSGLLLAALDGRTHAALQRQFLRREVEKRYVAVLEGDVAGDAGTIDLALRVDLDDRPRQIHDPVHGRRAVTRWKVLSRGGGRTRVALFPLTGRTHQLRAHCAHPLGLRAPIVGDRLYGHEGPRLHLHAEALAFRHPETGAAVSLASDAPF